MSSGSANGGSFGNATSLRYGAGGSGEPLTREVVHGTRLSMPTGFLSGESAADVGPNNASGNITAANGRGRISQRMTPLRERRIGVPCFEIIAVCGRDRPKIPRHNRHP